MALGRAWDFSAISGFSALFIDDVNVVERILKHLKVWDPQPDTLTPAGPSPPLPPGETLSLTPPPRSGPPAASSAGPVRPAAVAPRSSHHRVWLVGAPRPPDGGHVIYVDYQGRNCQDSQVGAYAREL